MAVNAENTIPFEEGRGLIGGGGIFSGALARLSRVLGFGQARAPQRPEVRHPLERLTLSDGIICRTHHDQVAGEYMPLSEIGIVRKESLKELDDGRCEYRFELSQATDPVWRFYLKRLLPGLAVLVNGRGLVLTCFPAELEGSYRRVKDAMALANVWHQEERERLAPLVEAKDLARRMVREMEENRKLGLRRQFEYLEL